MSVEILSTAAQLYEKSHLKEACNSFVNFKVIQCHQNCHISDLLAVCSRSLLRAQFPT